MSRFVAIDFETANQHRESACSIGVVVYENGELIDKFSSLIRPHFKYGFFAAGNQRIHGITPKMGKTAPCWDYVERQIHDWLEDAVIVAHNASFDVGILDALNKLYHIEHSPYRYLDTVDLSRIIYPDLYNHKLGTITKFLEIEHKEHDAYSDAYGCSMIVIDAMTKMNEWNIENLAKELLMTIKTM